MPEQIRVAGFDDDNPSFYKLPKPVVPLTTIQQPLYEAGSKAVSVLLSQIKDPVSPKQKAVLRPRLIRRDSTRPWAPPTPVSFLEKA